MPATKGNVELMKVMAFMNFNTDFFTKKGYRMGEIKAVNSYSGGTLTQFEDLKYNFAKLCENYGYVKMYNLGTADI